MYLPTHDQCKILIVGLGYVGLPLAIQFAKHDKCLKNDTVLNQKVAGFDINSERINELIAGKDKTNEVENSLLKDLVSQQKLSFTNSIKGYENFDFFIVTVPTPIDECKKPNLGPILQASKSIGKLLKNRKSKISPIVIYESTVFPGSTEDICAPIIEEESGLKYNKDFYCGYSPERINPGDKEHRLTSITKVVSGSSFEVTKIIDNLYSSIIKAGTYIAPSIKIAEAAKVIENTQRDLNIALVNEFAMLFKKMELDTLDILETAGSKWNFLPFRPGLVGGHCIGVDPYYLTFKAQQIGFTPKVILAGRETNDNMTKWLDKEFLLECKKREIPIKNINIMFLGITFKENCPDFRNTMVIELINSIKNYSLNITIVDPWVDKKEIKKIFEFNILDQIPINIKFDCVVCTVAHRQFKNMELPDWEKLLNGNGFFFDIKGIIPRELNPVRI